MLSYHPLIFYCLNPISGEAEKRNTQLGTPTASCYEDDEELSKMLTELGISSLYKPLHTAAITTNVLWDMSDKDLYDIGLNKGSQLLYKKAKVEWENEERNKKGKIDYIKLLLLLQ